MRIIEFPVLLASLIAVRLHFSESGGRELTLVAKFHVTHALFCVSYCSQYAILYFSTGSVQNWNAAFLMTRCSVWWPVYDINVLFQIITLCIFFNYWHAVYSTTSDCVSTARVKVYALLVVLWLAGEFKRSGGGLNCGSENKELLMKMYCVMDFVYLVDCLIVTSLVIRASEQPLRICFGRSKTSSSRQAVARTTFGQLGPFVILLLSLFIANALTVAEFIRDIHDFRSADIITASTTYSGFSTLKLLFILQFPSIMTLFIMWKSEFSCDLFVLAGRKLCAHHLT